MADKKFYITTPIFYPNANLHLGHAYTTTLSDILMRYHKMLGENTYFLTGADENTQKVVEPSKAVDMDPRSFLDQIVDNFKELFKELNIDYNQFIRTSDQKLHWPGAITLWKKLDVSGDLYKKEYEGLYCVGHEAFITEKDLVDGKCPDHGTVPERLKEENYFFKLSHYTQEIKKCIESDELKIVPATRKNEILALLGAGLEDVSFSRPKNAHAIGIPVPGDDSQVMYVWCDALSNYITALGYGRPDDANFKEYWPADVHVIGKDILRFHAAIWPAMLISAGLPLPKALLVHGFITSGGKKMSKTLGNVIDPQELLAEYKTDAVRYYLARYISPFEDGDITREHFKGAYNADLANGLGNLASRIMKLAEEYGAEPNFVPEPLPAAYTEAFDKFEVNRAAEFVWQEIARVDKDIADKAPFKLIKTDLAAGKKMIGEFVVELARINRMLQPFMPQTTKKISDAIVANKKPENLFPRKD